MDDYQPGVSAWDAVRRFWWLLLAFAAIGAGVAYYVVYQEREPVYTAEARLAVGRVDVATQAIPGFATASNILADSYSRAIVADEVINETAVTTGLPRDSVADNLDASPLPESGIVRVRAEAATEAEAVSMANAGADALSGYIREINEFNPDARRILGRYREAAREHAEAVAARDQIKETVRNAEKRARADSKVAQALLEQETYGQLYRATQAGQSAPNTLQVLARAGDAKGDRDDYAQRAGFAGAVAGLLLALLIAIPLTKRRERKQMRAAIPV